MTRFLLAAFISGATCLGLVTTAQATTRLSAAIAAPAPAPVLTVDAHCGPHRHWVPRYHRHGHWYGGYCAHNH